MDILFKILYLLFLVIAIILFFLLLFLIIPFKYVLKSNCKDKVLNIKFNYSFFWCSLFLDYNKKIKYYFKIFNFKIMSSDKNKTKNKKESVEDSDFIKNKNLVKVNNEFYNDNKDFYKQAKNYDKIIEKSEIKDEDILNDNNSENENYKKNINDLISELLYKIIPYNKIELVKMILSELNRIYKKLLPKKFIFAGEIGFEEPDKTGKVLSLISPLYSLYGENIKVIPHFDKKILKFKLKIIGRFNLIIVVVIAVRLLLNKKFRKLLKS